MHSYRLLESGVLEMLSSSHSRFFFFFFQAEDGIRDYKVTGVQTCALPISSLFNLNFSPISISLPFSSTFIEVLSLNLSPRFRKRLYRSPPDIFSLNFPSRDRKSVV